MFQHQTVYSQPNPSEQARFARTGDAWSIRRKLFVILAASLGAWIVWGGAGLLIWRALQS
jgi:hypothetical protein